MKFLANSDAANWCKAAPRSLTLREELIPSFGGMIAHSIKYEVPSDYFSIVQLLHHLLTLCTEGGFEGGMIWQLNWWSEKESEKVTLKTIDKIRQAYGELRPLEDAPACLVGTSELYDAIALLVHPLQNTWAAQFVSVSGRCIMRSTVSGYLYFMLHDKETVDRVLERTAAWKPWQEIPGGFKQRESGERIP
jgi:hypothetical protein